MVPNGNNRVGAKNVDLVGGVVAFSDVSVMCVTTVGIIDFHVFFIYHPY